MCQNLLLNAASESRYWEACQSFRSVQQVTQNTIGRHEMHRGCEEIEEVQVVHRPPSTRDTSRVKRKGCLYELGSWVRH